MLPKLRRGYRRIVVHMEEWTYKVGSGGSKVYIRDPADKLTVATGSEVTGLGISTIERGQYKKTTDGMILPSHVRAYIDKIRERK